MPARAPGGPCHADNEQMVKIPDCLVQAKCGAMRLARYRKAGKGQGNHTGGSLNKEVVCRRGRRLKHSRRCQTTSAGEARGARRKISKGDGTPGKAGNREVGAPEKCGSVGRVEGSHLQDLAEDHQHAAGKVGRLLHSNLQEALAERRNALRADIELHRLKNKGHEHWRLRPTGWRGISMVGVLEAPGSSTFVSSSAADYGSPLLYRMGRGEQHPQKL